MEFIVVPYGSLCSLKEFKINGVDADKDDFVDQFDHSPGLAEDYSCGDMMADVKLPTSDVLKKYGITLDEYYCVAEDVAEKVSFGCCGLCS